MGIETLGQAYSAGWRLHARCTHGYEPSMKRRRCSWNASLDMLTLVATRGRGFPLGDLQRRLMCPYCGSRVITVMFQPPASGMARMMG
jgi:hypothetical protein